MSIIDKAKINKHYNKFVIGFVILAFIIVIFTGYFAFTKTIIVIIPQPKEVSVAMPVLASKIDAKFATKELSETFDYRNFSTQTSEEEGYAIGKVTIYNEYVADQSLVATTRLLSKEGVLFRTQANVVVPKGGSIEVDVKADQKGKSGNISASSFEIVALNAVKKEQIYAKSESSMAGGIIASTVITEKDVADAKNGASESILNKAFEEFNKEFTEIAPEQVTMEIIRQETDVTAGQKAEAISVQTKAKFSLAELNKAEVLNLCRQKLQEKKGENYVIKVNENLTYTLGTEDEEQILNIDCAGIAFLSSQNNLIKKEQLINKTINQVKSYLENFVEIQSAEISLSPFWIQTTPFIKENIIIEVKSE